MKRSADAGELTVTAARRAAVEHTAAPPLAPNESAIEFAHLARMTLGDSKLERELLTLFECQVAMLVARMANEPPGVVGSLAHTLTGSARGVGAWKVAEASEALERLASQPGPGALTAAFDRLTTAVEEVRAALADYLRGH